MYYNLNSTYFPYLTGIYVTIITEASRPLQS